MTLRTVSPQASRVVSPTAARSRMTSGTRSSCTKWNWTFWRVVMWPQPREYVVGDVGHHVELLGRDAAVGDLDAHHLVVAALALAVDAVVEAEDAEDVLVEVAGEVPAELRLELVDVGQLGGIDLSRQHAWPRES